MKKLIGIALLFISTVASAQDTTVATMADNVVDQINQFPDVLGAASYVLGIVVGIKALLKFKEHSESKGQQVKLSVPITMLAASALFLGLPTVLKMGVDTFGYKDVPNAQFQYNYSKENY